MKTPICKKCSELLSDPEGFKALCSQCWGEEHAHGDHTAREAVSLGLADPLDTFTRAYLECALWSSNDNSDDQGGDPLDQNYDISDIAPETLRQALEDCTAFQKDNADDLALVAEYQTSDRAGHNFWLNRNGHGSGFWDEYFGKDKTIRAAFVRLSEACKPYGSVDLYVGDDGLIYS